MDINELRDLLDADVKIDSTKLQYEASNNPTIYAKWLRIYSEAKREIVGLEAKRKKAMKNRLDFYTNRSDNWCNVEYDKSELKVVMASDDDILPLDTKIAYYQMILDFASKALDIIKSRGFAIKNMIELRSLEAGR